MLSDNAYHHHDAQQRQPAGFHTAPLEKVTLGIKILKTHSHSHSQIADNPSCYCCCYCSSSSSCGGGGYASGAAVGDVDCKAAVSGEATLYWSCTTRGLLRRGAGRLDRGLTLYEYRDLELIPCGVTMTDSGWRVILKERN